MLFYEERIVIVQGMKELEGLAKERKKERKNAEHGPVWRGAYTCLLRGCLSIQPPWVAMQTLEKKVSY